MASFFSNLFSAFRAKPKVSRVRDPSDLFSPTDAPVPVKVTSSAPLSTGIFSRMTGSRPQQNVWQDPLWIPASAELQHMAMHAGTRKQILIVDNDALAVADCKAMVEGEGFLVETAFDGEEGVRKVLEANPDVVILRLQLPKLNGIEVIRRLRSNDAHKRLPIIALAEADSSLSEADALAAGATRVFDRGTATEDDLFLALRTALRKRVFTPKKQLFLQKGTATIKLGTSIVQIPQELEKPIAAPVMAPSGFRPPTTPVRGVPPNPTSPGFDPVGPIAPAGPAVVPSPVQARHSTSIETMPAGSAAPPAVAEPPPPSNGDVSMGSSSDSSMGYVPGQKRILLIEDEDMVATIYRARLTRAGYAVEVAADGETGLHRLRQSPPDAVLLDAHLPRMDGLQVLQLIRSDVQLAKLPVILCTAALNPRMQEEALLAGAVRVLDKTAITPLQVVEAMQSLFAEQKISAAILPPDPSASTIKKITTIIVEPPPGHQMAEYLPPDDKAFEAEIREAFLQDAPSSVAMIQADSKALMKTAVGSPERLQFVDQLFKTTHKLAGTSGLAGFSQVSRLSSAIEGLLIKIGEKPERLNASCMRTLVQAIDYLGLAFSRASALRDYEKENALALVVDDEMIGRRYVAHSLMKADLPYHSSSNAMEALKLLQEYKFDLIFLDVEMPGMNGFELCKHLRTLPGYERTPVIFVTSLNSFDALAKSKMSGGTDFLAKPFSYAELSVKALTCLARRGMELLPTADQQRVTAAAAALGTAPVPLAR
ncbi:hypothetical protein AYO41_01290 [Verrucomicrobia bacterium SCGC AG-212-E04]|nr:hypothetical protein AYO41_01290 [Verrucomicrobia bacterium SCGC AG-212-E04]